MHQYLYGYNQNNVQMMMMMMMMAGQIKLILKTIRFTCTKSQHYDSPNFFLFVHHKWCPGQKLVCPFYKENYLQICSNGYFPVIVLSLLKSSERKNTHRGIYYNDMFRIKRLVLQKRQGYCSGTWKNGTWPGTKGSGEKEECWGKNKNITKGKLNYCCCCFFSLKEMVADLDTGKTLLESRNISGNVTCFDGKSGWN